MFAPLVRTLIMIIMYSLQHNTLVVVILHAFHWTQADVRPALHHAPSKQVPGMHCSRPQTLLGKAYHEMTCTVSAKTILHV